jgi:hypothetical protein
MHVKRMKVTIISFVAFSIMLSAIKPVQAQCNIPAYTLTLSVRGPEAYNDNNCGRSPTQNLGYSIAHGTAFPLSVYAIGIDGAGSYATVTCTASDASLGIYQTILNVTSTSSINASFYWTPTVAGTYTLACYADYNIPYGSGNSGTIYTGNIIAPVT